MAPMEGVEPEADLGLLEDQEASLLKGEGILVENRYGYFDGTRFCLRSFPVWYRWKQVPEGSCAADGGLMDSPGDVVASSFKIGEQGVTASCRDTMADPFSWRALLGREKRSSGIILGVDWSQTFGRMELSCPLDCDDEDLVEEKLRVEMSALHLQVSVYRYVEGLQRLEHLSGDLHACIHPKLSWWRVMEDDGQGSGRWLFISLAKRAHKAWTGPWCLHPRNLLRQRAVGYKNAMEYDIVRRGQEHLSGIEEDLLQLPPGEPEEFKNELLKNLDPDGLCTGMEEEEDELHAYVVVHLDEENLDTATAQIPLEDMFAADVEEDSLKVFVRGVNYGICEGSLNGLCVPEMSTWEVNSIRRKLPPKSQIKAPAYYNRALRIKLVKADNCQGFWGGTYREVQKRSFQPPRMRMSWSEQMQRAMVLSPTAPVNVTAKVEHARRLCTFVESSQDESSASIVIHLDKRLEMSAHQYKLDIGTFFAMRVAERNVEVSVVADCEYSMCYGWLGGPCMPEETRWETVRYPAREHEVKVVAASGGATKLTVQEAVALQEELVAGFKQPSFQHRMHALKLKHEADSSGFRQERQPLALTVQARVLPRYGFAGNASGLTDMLRFLNGEAAAEFNADSRYVALAEEANFLLHVYPKVPPLTKLTEDGRFLGTWFFIGQIVGQLCITREDDKPGSPLSIAVTTCGMTYTGNLEPQAEVGTALHANLTMAGKSKLRSEPEPHHIVLSIDEGSENLVFSLRRSPVQSFEQLIARSESKVLADKHRAAECEEHLAVKVRVAKAPGAQHRWRSVFTHADPGEPMPEEANELLEDGVEQLE